MDTDILADKVQELLDADKGEADEKTVRRRIKVNKDLWKRFGDEADRLGLAEGQFLELLLTTSGTTHKDKVIAEQKESLEAMKKTIEHYREKMKIAGIDLSKF